MGAMLERADVIVVGAGVQGASLAFHLARRGADVLVLERSSIAAGATGRSSGFIRMHYDLESEARLAWTSFPYFTDWAGHVGVGDPGFVRTGFLQLVPAALADALRANVAMHQAIGIETRTVGPSDVADLVPGATVDDIVVGAYEPRSGYGDPSATAAGFIAAAREHGARYEQGRTVTSVAADGDRIVGVETDRGRISAPVVVDAAGAWAPELARTVGLEIPVQPWRHDTAYLGLPDGHDASFPIVLDHGPQVYFRPEGREQMLAGLEIANELGGAPDRPFRPIDAEVSAELVRRVCERVPWMVSGSMRGAFGGQDGMTPDQRPIVDRVGPDGFYLLCGFSGTGFKTAPAIGAAVADWILDGGAPRSDIAPFTLRRFADGAPLVGRHPYGHLWQ
jgi:sarcosine oxidase, subunit beta